MTVLVLSAIEATAVVVLWVAMPETRPPAKQPTHLPNAKKATLPV